MVRRYNSAVFEDKIGKNDLLSVYAKLAVFDVCFSPEGFFTIPFRWKS